MGADMTQAERDFIRIDFKMEILKEFFGKEPDLRQRDLFNKKLNRQKQRYYSKREGIYKTSDVDFSKEEVDKLRKAIYKVVQRIQQRYRDELLNRFLV